jgi:hypothetical protein
MAGGKLEEVCVSPGELKLEMTLTQRPAGGAQLYVGQLVRLRENCCEKLIALAG